MSFELLDRLSTEWSLIKQTPRAILIAGVAIFFTVNAWSEHEKSNLRSDVETWKNQAQAYSSRLGGTPDQVKARLDALEAQVGQLRPRRLSSEQREKLTLVLSETVGSVSVVQDMQAADVKLFCGDLVVTFRAAGWSAGSAAVFSFDPLTEVVLEIPDPAHLSKQQALIAKSLRTAGIQFNIRKSDMTLRPTVDATLYISTTAS